MNTSWWTFFFTTFLAFETNTIITWPIWIIITWTINCAFSIKWNICSEERKMNKKKIYWIKTAFDSILSIFSKFTFPIYWNHFAQKRVFCYFYIQQHWYNVDSRVHRNLLDIFQRIDDLDNFQCSNTDTINTYLDHQCRNLNMIHRNIDHLHCMINFHNSLDKLKKKIKSKQNSLTILESRAGIYSHIHRITNICFNSL